MLSRADVLPLDHALSYVECDLLEDETLSEYRRRLERDRASWQDAGVRRRLKDIDLDTLGFVFGVMPMLVIPTVLIVIYVLTGWLP